MTGTGTDSAKPGRRRYYDLDLLYIIVLSGVIVSHAMIIFAPGPYLPPYGIKNPVLYRGVADLALFTGFTAMPVFFLLSGWTSLLALQRHSWADFAWERAKRLFVPLVFGMIAIAPIIKYYELRSGFDFRFLGPRIIAPREMTYWEYFPETFMFKRVSWSHLWFLLYLFLISLAASPVLVWLIRDGKLRLPEAKSGARLLLYAYLPLIPAALVQIVFGGWWPFYPTLINDWGNISQFGFWFVIGGFLAANPPLQEAVRREWWRLGLIGLAAFAVQASWPEQTVGRLAAGITGWGAFGGFIGLVALAKPTGGKVLRYFRDATLPIYILHNFFMIIIGFHTVRQDWAVLPKFAFILILTMAITLAVYHWVVRPVPLLRFFFGLRPRRRQPT